MTKEALQEAKAIRKELVAAQKADRMESTDQGAEMEEETDKAGETAAEATAGSLAKAGDYEGALNVIRGKIAGNEEKLAARKSVLETWKQIGALVGIQ